MHVVKEGTSKQAWLNTVRSCPECGGQKPKSLFKRVDGVDICHDCQKEHPEVAEDNKIMNAWMFLRHINELCHFQTREGKKVGSASNSELKRWCQNGAFIINGETVKWDELIDFPVFSVVLFPKHPITLL